jgi:hypothetical protein
MTSLEDETWSDAVTLKTGSDQLVTGPHFRLTPSLPPSLSLSHKFHKQILFKEFRLDFFFNQHKKEIKIKVERNRYTTLPL